MLPGARTELLAGLALDDLVALVNAAYVGYPGPFTPEEPMGYAAFLRAQAIDLARSVIARDPVGAPIGLALLGIRGARGWIGEFGVVPAWRRQGLGRALLAAVLASASSAGVTDVRLEVRSANTPAQALYAAGGFTVERTLHNYRARAAAVAADPDPDVTIRGVDPGILAVDLGLPTDPAPAWDQALPALLTESGARTLLAERGGRPAGLLHYLPDPEQVEIRRLAVAPADLPAARALLAAAASRPAVEFVAAYVADTNPLHALLPALGFAAAAPDLEMARRF